jgi:hypothetical protein
MLNIVCVKHGSLYGADYVNRLYAMVARNLTAGHEGRFICFTDDDAGIRQEIHCRPLPKGILGWWNKLALFAPGEFERHDRILYFDLDTVMVGDLDEIARYDGEFAILRDFYREDGWQSSVMAWKSGFGAEIWQRWNREGRPEADGGDQEWIEHVFKNKWPVIQPEILQDLYPGKFVSYKRDCIPYPPEGASVVVFHGEPKPHDCGRSWVEAMWTESDTGHFQLAMIPNIPLEQIRKQAKHSATLGLPRLKSQPANQGTASPFIGKVAIIGGGPSIGDPVIQAELSLLRSKGFAIWALNGSYDWLLDRGLVADAHVLLDARYDNLRFLRNSEPETTYYLASICSGFVYDELITQGRKIVRFDLDVMGDCGTTVGTHAIAVAFTEGFREIHLYGYDSSYRGDAGHAYEQALNGEERIVDAHVGDRTFRAAPWMVRQAQDFDGLAAAIVSAGGTIVVHGDGLLPYVAQQMAAPRWAEVRAAEVLKRLPAGPVRGAEIGVFCGGMSAALLQRPDLDLLMVDSWEGDGKAYLSESGDWHAKLSRDEQNSFMKIASRAVDFAGCRATIRRVRSRTQARSIGIERLDFVFIDADHSYQGCKADIVAWAPRIKPGGLLCGHDYDNPDFPEFGVKRAVDEYAATTGRQVELGANLTWFIRL